MSDCLFCKIIAGLTPTEKLYEDDDAIAFWDIRPQAPKHFLVVPKKHLVKPSDMNEDDDALMGKLVRIGSLVASQNGIEGSFRIVINNGKDANQIVMHTHLHFLGGRRMKWPPG